MAEENLELVGGDGGEEIKGFIVPEGAKISAISLLTGLYVDTLEIAYQGADGAEVRLGPIGGFGGVAHLFELGEGEYLTGISGRNGVYIDSIRFHTNLRTSDTFGGPFGSAEFALNAPEGSQIVGFVGRAGWFIDALGIVTRPLLAAPKASRKRAAKAEKVVKAEKAPKAAKAEKALMAETAQAVEEAPKAKKAPGRKKAETAPAVEEAPKAKKAPGRKKAATAPAVEEAPKAKKAPGRKKAETAPAVEEAPKAKKAPGRKKAETAPAVEEAPKAKKAPGRKKAAQVAEAPVEAVIAVPTEAPIEAPTEAPTEAPIEAPIEVSAEATRSDALQLPAPVEREPNSEDLQKVEGIGPKIAEMLIANGIYDLSDLAATPVEQLREILDGAGPRYRIANPTTWPEQAALGAAGDWEAFNALTAQLKRGRRV